MDFETRRVITIERRDYNIDLIKTISIFAVLLIHINAPITGAEFLGKTWYLSIFLGSMVRFAVPMFFMCTGALLYNENKEVPLEKIWKKYIPRFFIAFVFWDLFYILVMYVKQALNAIPLSSLWDLYTMVIQGNNKYHLYFILIIICIYALVPVTKTFISNASREVLAYFLVFWIGTSMVLPLIFTLYPEFLVNSLVRRFSWGYIYNFLGYTILGYYLKKYGVTYKRGPVLGLTLASLLALICLTLFLSKRAGQNDLSYWEAHTFLVFVYASGLFVLMNKIRVNNGRALLEKISNSTFSIYLTHVFFLELFSDFRIDVFHIPVLLKPVFPPALALVIFGLSYLTYQVLIKKLPFGKYIS